MENEKSRKVNKTKRIPVSGHRDVLTVHGKEDGYVYRWVNDENGRIDRFQAAGYEMVQHDVDVGQRTVDSSKGTSSTVSKYVGQGVTSYLMRTKEEYYKEDQEAKQRAIDATEADMKRALNSKQNGTYGKVDFE